MTTKAKGSKTETKTKTTDKKKKAQKSSSKKVEVKEEVVEEPTKEKKIEKTDTEKLAETEDKYLRLAAEYDNYRRRTLKEKSDLLKSGGEDVLIGILPVIDDLERALGSIDQAKDIAAVKEGIELIYGKFKEFMKQRGVKEIEAKEKEFDTDLHEAVTKIPAPADKLKGKVVDVIEKGYMLNDKVIRFSKVVIGE